MDLTLLIIVALVALILYTVGGRLYRFYLFRQRVNKIPGPDYAIPFCGMVFQLMSVSKEGRLDWLSDLINQYKDGFMRTWVGTVATVHIQNPEHIEVILRSNTQLTKSAVYEYLVPFLGRGLNTSSGPLWFHHRKLITPAFHLSVLEDFANVMIDKTAILNSCIEREINIHGDKPFDISVLCLRCALDIICETAMGTNIHAQEAIENQYIGAVDSLTTGALNRYYQPWLLVDWIFYRTTAGKSFKAAADIANDFCTRVIKSKQEERKSGVALRDKLGETEVKGKRKRKAFLDLLLEANEKEDNPLTIEEIRDETNTFMFGGHDTVGALIGWALFSLGNDLDAQRKVHEELDDVLGDSDNVTTLKKLPDLKYLERVIKEVLRLYPSINVISRYLREDMLIGDYTVPAGVNLDIQIDQLHRDPTVWPNPLHFNPDRFLPENVKTRHPYAYVPFSSGPRICIGQKYAMLEAKIVLAQILRNFSVKSVENHSTIKKFSAVTLRPVNGIYVNMTKRSIGVK